jgi:hypothetical protein
MKRILYIVLIILLASLPAFAEQMYSAPDLLDVDKIIFDVDEGGSEHIEGTLEWNGNDHTLDIHTDKDGVVLQVGQEQYVRAVNQTAGIINNGEAVIVTGSQGNRPGIIRANANAENTSHGTLGIATHDIAQNLEGFVTTSGLVRGIDTTGTPYGESWTDGDLIYLSATIAGGLTNAIPSAPNHATLVGYNLNTHAEQGLLFVKIQDGDEMYELHDVDSISSVNNDVLTWNDARSVWANTADIIMNSVEATPSVGEMYEGIPTHLFTADDYTSDLGAGDTLTVTGGSITNTTSIDDIAHELTEINATPCAAIYIFNTANLIDPGKVNVRLDYNGNHDMKVQLYNYNTPGYDDMTGDSTDFGKSMTDFDTYAFYLDPDVLGEPRSSYINGSGQVTVRIDHPNNGVNSHEILMDYVSVEKVILDLPIAGTIYTLTGLTEGITASDITVDAANAKFTVTRAGYYVVSGSLSFEAIADSDIHGAIYVNGVLQDKGTFHRGFTAADATGVAMMQSVINASIDDYIEFKFWSDVDNNYMILHHANIIMYRLN